MNKNILKKVGRIDGKIINEIVGRIVDAVHPERIILFGSYAYGKPKTGSDLDILVIMNSNLPRYKRSVPVYSALAGLLIPKDILVYTRKEVEEWSGVPQAFITTVLKKGKAIYEKEQGRSRKKLA